MRLVQYPENPTPADLRKAADTADANKEEAQGQVEFWDRLGRDLRFAADELEHAR